MNILDEKVNKRIVAFLLIFISLGLILNQSLFLHSHILYGGSFIQHAHPYDKSQNTNDRGETHHHSNIEIVLFENLSIFFIFFLGLLGVFLLLLKNISSQPVYLRIHTTGNMGFFNKGPPLSY